MRIYSLTEHHLCDIKDIHPKDNQQAYWIDMLNMSAEEEQLIEQVLGINIPSRAELNEIESSSRFYFENQTLYMTASVVLRSQSDEPDLCSVSFLLHKNMLITIRYEHLESFRIVHEKITSQLDRDILTSEQLFALLVHTMIDRLADALEDLDKKLETLLRNVFELQTQLSLRATLTVIGKRSLHLSKIHESLVSLLRLVMFASQMMKADHITQSLHRFSKDLASLQEHVTSLSQKIDLLLNTTLGLINIEQNNIIKTLSMAALIFMPPTLIASIYGMNFHHMPELEWLYGYPFALAAMCLSGIGSLWYAKKNKWL